MDIFIQGIRSLSPTGWYWCRYRCCGVRTLLMLIGVVVVLLVFTGVVVHILLIGILYCYPLLVLFLIVMCVCGVWCVACVVCVVWCAFFCERVTLWNDPLCQVVM